MLRYLTAGESHGKGLTVIIEGLPSGLLLDEEYIARDLSRRQKGYGRGGRMQIESDHAEILSGVRHGRTLGSPLALLIPNKDFVNWTKVMSTVPVHEPGNTISRLRPGHADLPGTMKYAQDDVRNILERASARETAARVAAGAVSRRFLEEFGIKVYSHVVNIGGVKADYLHPVDWERVEQSPVRCADAKAEPLMISRIDEAKASGDTVGGMVEVVAVGVPIGLGSHVHWDRKIDGRIAQALMSINAVKAVAIGEGWESADLLGSQYHDVIQPVRDKSKVSKTVSPYPTASGPWHRLTNRGGGTEGGMTNGMPIIARFVVKPISTMAQPLPSVDLVTGEEVRAHYERSDVCQVPPAGVIGEAMVAFELAVAFQEKFGGDNIEEARRNFQGYQKTVRLRGDSLKE